MGGIANSNTVSALGTILVYSGASINDTTVDSRGNLCIYSGGKMTGQMIFEEGAFISAYEGAIFDFNISELAPENATARINNLSVIQGTPFYTLTISESQADGVYSLATGAASFDSTITVTNISGDSLGTLIVGETVKIDGDDYTLSRNGGLLTLSINAEIMETTDPVVPVVTDPGKDVLLDHIMPEAEYMYGCVPTAIGMILGYYDLYGYGNAGFSNLIEGNVALKSRGTDGDAFNMNAFDTVLGRAIASEDYVYRFHSRDGVETTPEQELEYAFMPDNQTLNTDVWNCIADYLGTGQYWRGNKNLDTSLAFGSLNTLYNQEITITSGSTSRTIRAIDQSMEFGLDLYVKSRGYKLDDSITGTYPVIAGHAMFTLYKEEIDAGRPVLIGIDDHAMVGYGYNESTQEIIFDNGYESGQRMVWGGTYRYAGEDRELQSITVIALDESSGEERAIVVSVPDKTFFIGRFAGGIQSMLAKQDEGAGVVTVYREGANWGAGLTLDPGWDVVGVGDFNGDKLDDFLRVNTEGYVVGEMSNDNGTFSPQVLNLKNAGWDILGTGNFDGVGADDVLIANPTAASETVGLLGYWESGVTWTLINGYSPEWECVSTGDFNGDGKCDMLWKNEFIGEGGLTYNAYCTWIVEDPVDWRMVSVANPAEWNFLCSGDFDGNGSHDIAMINDVGVVGIWGVNDGYLNSWSILSAVDTSAWTLAGVGDFNADGTDDIAWASDSLGLAGYWQINDKQLTTWQNIATIA